jgi:hypothetical protein
MRALRRFSNRVVNLATRRVITQPGNSGSSIKTKTSIGSPSSASVEGTNPKSYGKAMPAGRTVLRMKVFSSGSKAYIAASFRSFDEDPENVIIVGVYWLQSRGISKAVPV